MIRNRKRFDPKVLAKVGKFSRYINMGMQRCSACNESSKSAPMTCDWLDTEIALVTLATRGQGHGQAHSTQSFSKLADLQQKLSSIVLRPHSLGRRLLA